MNPDGIAYLDIGDAYFRGDWEAALNPVWSPLYSWVLGLAGAIGKPSIEWEFPLVHLVNLGIFAFALASFAFFWRELGRAREETLPVDEVGLPDWAWPALGYLLFTWTTLTLISIWAVTPDMLMAGLVLLAAGLIVKLRRSDRGWPWYFLLGAVLGLAYLSKTVMLPLALVFIAVAALGSDPGRRTGWRPASSRALVTLMGLLVVSGPFVGAISRQQGRLTFGNVGTLTYLRVVNGIPFPHWQGVPASFGTPSHPSRQIFDDPPVYEFGEPIAGTYPISYDPSHWYDGAVVSFDAGAQLRTLIGSFLYYFDLLFRDLGILLGAILMLYLVGRSGRAPPRFALRRIESPTRTRGLALVALVAFSLYSVVYVEGRYLAVFVLLLCADLLAGVRLADVPLARRATSVASLVMIGFLLASLGAFYLEGFNRLGGAAGDRAGTDPAQDLSAEAGPVDSRPLAIAEALRDAGVEPGERVGVIGWAFKSYWARLARVRIVAEMFGWEADPFWRGDDELRGAVLRAFAEAGAGGVVAESVPPDRVPAGWEPLGASGYFLYRFSTGGTM